MNQPINHTNIYRHEASGWINAVQQTNLMLSDSLKSHLKCCTVRMEKLLLETVAHLLMTACVVEMVLNSTKKHKFFCWTKC